MSQTAIMFGALVIAFVVFITLKGQLANYLGVFGI